MRRIRYEGLAKTRLQHMATTSGINLTGVADWLSYRPRAKTRRSAVVTLPWSRDPGSPTTLSL
jgi:hypothetical protein